MIRDTKKNSIVNQLLSNSAMDTETITVVPGQATVVKFPLVNDGHSKEVFRFTVRDPDEDFLMIKNKDGKVIEIREELKVPSTAEELAYLVKTGLIDRPNSWDAITKRGDIMLDVNDKITVPLVFLTQREASLST